MSKLAKSTEGTALGPSLATISFSMLSWRRRRFQLAITSLSWPRTSVRFRSRKRWGRGLRAVPANEANESEISPSLLPCGDD